MQKRNPKAKQTVKAKKHAGRFKDAAIKVALVAAIGGLLTTMVTHTFTIFKAASASPEAQTQAKKYPETQKMIAANITMVRGGMAGPGISHESLHELAARFQVTAETLRHELESLPQTNFSVADLDDFAKDLGGRFNKVTNRLVRWNPDTVDGIAMKRELLNDLNRGHLEKVEKKLTEISRLVPKFPSLADDTELNNRTDTALPKRAPEPPGRLRFSPAQRINSH